MKNRKLVFIVSLIFASCQEKTYYENNGASCKLTLYKDGTYKYITPWFFRTDKEFGKYKFHRDTLFLETKNYNNKDSILNIEYFCGNDTPSLLKIRTINCENKIALSELKINKSDKRLVSNLKGEYYISYKQLENDSIIQQNKNLDFISIYFGDKEYKINMMKEYSDSRKPEELVFKINDYAGQASRPLIRKYNVNKDTIYINDISKKLTGFYNSKLIKN
jgi:hypothetical protein